ncbi:hypothetical protein ASZ90_017221 [hydrocarbon metagenome]|uniref:Uncharacterized protein n=1 Tax=hydrocarbon metagenome TaxID=938273 RepID=A0A0W8E9S9_9ZZZZ
MITENQYYQFMQLNASSYSSFSVNYSRLEAYKLLNSKI